MIFLQGLILVAACMSCYSEPWMAKNTLTAEEISAILKAHNDYRATIGASNMLQLRWNPEMADLAEGHAQRCNVAHVNMELPDGITVGQNLYMSSGSSLDVTNGVLGWIAEKKDYDMEKLQCRKSWEHCGHLTQVISANTQWIGCAVKRNCGGKWKSLMVCNYLPGNNAKSIKFGRACSACPNARCVNGLCACDNPLCKRGKLETETCECQCDNPFTGAACDEKACPKTGDPSGCGKARPWGYPKSYCSNVYAAFTAKKCPFMCGICDYNSLCPGKSPGFCGKHGKLDLETCKCVCQPFFSGEVCEKKDSCPADPEHCGKPQPAGFPKEFCTRYRGFMKKECPVMCGAC